MGKAKILIVDDEDAILSSVRRIALRLGHEIETAGSSQAALGLVKRQSFDLLITDLKLPGVGGLGIAREFRRINPRGQVIVITGFPSMATAEEAVDVGVFEYLSKPFDVKDLETAIGSALKSGEPRSLAFTDKHVLIVEDNAVFSHLLKEMMVLRGIQVQAASSAGQALRLLEEGKKFDLIVCDVGLPDFSGIELCRKIKENPRCCAARVLVMTATYAADVNTETSAKKAGADFFTVKPVDPYELCFHVERLLGGAGSKGDG